MRISDFLKDKLFSIPKDQPPREDFKKFVFRNLDTFLGKLSLVEFFDDIEFSMNSIIERQTHLIENLKNAINHYYDGKPSDAYQYLIKGLNSDVKNFSDLLRQRIFDENSDFYRIRFHKENFSLPTNQFFHIPFNLRGKVKTQRYSIPGFPSLYLGTTVYVCWEELNRPNLNDFQAVRLRNKQRLRVIDLSPPIIANESPYDYYKYLMTWPLIFTSSIRVRNIEDPFKPEYIIPQLLLQWIREMPDFDGISYQTTHIDFTNTLSDGEFLNLVLPVRENKSKGLCRVLSEKFEITEATSIQLNQSITNSFSIDTNFRNHMNGKIRNIELVKGRAFPYSLSAIGGLERTLLEMELKKIEP